MANGSTTLARIQGQGLVETAPTGTAEMASAGFTPAGALQKGLSPDAAKMAGTPPAKVNAIRMAMQDVGSRRLSALREMAAPQLEADARTQGIARQASVLGRLDETMSAYINTQLTAAFNQSILKAGNTDARLKGTVYAGDATKQAALTTAVANINKGQGTDADVKTVNDALAAVNSTQRVSLAGDTGALTNAQIIANNLFENLTPEQMQKAFGEAVAKANASTLVGSFLQSSDADTFAKGQGIATEGMENPSDALEALLSTIVPDKQKLSSMKLGDLTDAIKTWREENFKDVAEYQKTLTDPSATPAQFQLALENLRRLGKVGVIAADAKVGDLDAQMRDGDTINIDGQQFDIASFFTEPEKLAELKGWLNKPDTAPASLRPWIEGNRDAIQTKVNELNPDLQKLSETVKENMKAVELPENVQLDSATAEYFFGDLTKPTIAAKTVPEKYQLLKDVTTGPAMVTLLNRLKTIGNGLDGKQMFNTLSVDQLKKIISNNGVERYINNAIKQKQTKDFTTQSFDESNFAGNFRMLLSDDNLGMDDAGQSLARLMNRDLSLYVDVFKNAGLEKPPINLLVNGKLNVNVIKEKLKEFAASNTDSLISGDGFTALKDFLNNKIMGNIRNSLARIPTAPEPPQSKGAEMPEAFHKGGQYKQTPDQRKRDLELTLSPISGTSFWIAKLEKELKAHNENEPRNWLGGKDKGWTAWKQQQERIQEQLNPYLNEREEARKQLEDLPNWTIRRQQDYEKWREKEVAKRDQKNEEYRQRYTEFTNILGGLV